ncbi:MAG: asparagine synthase (glutamine-hydrolyzing) [Chloroflexi bacterium]|nr:MAG: asparagine synthase (glutamine-hydrolyzing) [Chloroflexota bacterium]MBL1193691.1 asparagine synthase (glutamine-hydrolyzing) [Chloroflexota bacterium]NOH10983.1 asparagine synthase (glutamine-hydrolyzing) [Chloroflexota bacterium]
MCGIAGAYEYKSKKTISREEMGNMLQVIHHRGPDDDGCHLDDNLAIGMRRLSIVDIAGGHQPMYNEDNNLVLVFNGEIYNFPELREQLTAKGHVFNSMGDTETILHLYEEYGLDCVQHLRGMFTFALWDPGKRRLFLGRDRLGIKPLYFTDVDGTFVFGSEIKAILEYPGVDARPNMQALGHFLTYKYAPAPLTMFEGIQAVPPGYFVTVDEQGVRTQEYWDMSFAPSENGIPSEAEAKEHLQHLLRESVEMRLISDVPFGAFLSGGVDSSTIVALMSQILNQPVKTFSVGFKGQGEEYSELPYARMVAEQYQTDHHEVYVDSSDFVNLTEKIVWQMDQPIADQAALATYMVADLASKHVKMVLTGEGGDELFAGYARYAGERFSPYFRPIPQFLKNGINSAAGLLPGMRRPKLALNALLQPDELRRLTSWFPLFNFEQKQRLISPEFRSQLEDEFSTSIVAGQMARTDATDVLSRMLYFDTKIWLPDDLLARGDKMIMAASVEGRVPILDHKIVEFAASLPPSMKLKGMTSKYLLKEAARDWLPDTIIDRSKKGFPIPMAHWFRNGAREMVDDLLLSDTFKKRQLFDQPYVEKLLTDHQSGFGDYSSQIWALTNLELWHRQYIDA